MYNIQIISFYSCAFCVLSKKPLHIISSGCKDFLPCFLLQVLVLHRGLRSISSPSVNMVWDKDQCLFFFLIWISTSPKSTCWKSSLCLLNFTLAILLKIIWLHMCGSNSRFHTYPFTLPNWLDYCSFILSFGI